MAGLVTSLLVGFAPASASAAIPGQMEGTNFVATPGDCVDGLRTVQFSFDYTGGPDDWFIDRNPLDEGLTVTTGSVAEASGSVVATAAGQPAGLQEFALRLP